MDFHGLSIFEIGMLICFGASWPFAVLKTYKTKNGNKSMAFLNLIIVGYIFGIIHKLLYNNDIVTYLYLLNLLFVVADEYLCIRYRKKAS